MPACRWITLAELERRFSEWQALADAAGFPSAYASPGWILAWWQHYGAGSEPWCLAQEDEAGSLCCLALLARGNGPLVRPLRFAGGRWNGMDTLLCAPGLEEQFSAELLRALAARRSEWDLWLIQRLPATAALAGMLLEATATLRVRRPTIRLQPFLELPGTPAEYEARLQSKHHKDQRRKWRRLAELGASPRLVSDPAEIESALQTLLELRRGRSEAQGHRGTQMDARYEQFLLQVVRGMPASSALLWILEIEGQPLAALLNLAAGNRAHGVITAMGEAHAKLSPGTMLEHRAIADSIERGHTEFDLGPGRDEYKYRLGAVDRRMLRVRVASPSRRGSIVGALADIDLSLRETAVADMLRTRRGIAPNGDRAPTRGAHRPKPGPQDRSQNAPAPGERAATPPR